MIKRLIEEVSGRRELKSSINNLNAERESEGQKIFEINDKDIELTLGNYVMKSVGLLSRPAAKASGLILSRYFSRVGIS